MSILFHTRRLIAPPGTVMLFFNTAAPTGWTKDTTNYNDHAIRIVTGTPSSGGSSNFSTVFGKTATDNFTLTTAEIPAHPHQERNYAPTGGSGAGLAVSAVAQQGVIQSSRLPTTATDGGSGGAHAHNIDLRVKYADAIRATKD